MKFPDDVTVLRASAADEYGNPGASWDAPTEIAVTAFITGSLKVMLAAGSNLQTGDRLRWRGDDYAVEGLKTVRSPSRDVLMTAQLRLLEG